MDNSECLAVVAVGPRLRVVQVHIQVGQAGNNSGFLVVVVVAPEHQALQDRIQVGQAGSKGIVVAEFRVVQARILVGWLCRTPGHHLGKTGLWGRRPGEPYQLQPRSHHRSQPESGRKQITFGHKYTVLDVMLQIIL